MKNKFFVICSVLVAVLLMLAACGPSNSPQTTEENEEETSQESEETSEEVEAAEAVEQSEEASSEESSEEVEDESEPVSLVGGTVKMAMTAEPDTLDPHFTLAGASYAILSNIYSTLILGDNDGIFYPYLAESWEASEDGLNYTFYLKENVTFHNGQPFTAEDVIWTYNRILDPELGSPHAGNLSNVENISAIDEYTVEFSLLEPTYYFLDILASGYFGILNKEAVEEMGEEYGRNPVGTGPYKFVEWVTGDQVMLERNPLFTWGPPITNGAPPNIEQIVYQVIPEAATIVAGYEAGEIDFLALGEIAPQDANYLDETGQFFVLHNPISGLFPYVSFNLDSEPFNNVLVRQALCYATEKEMIRDIVVPNSGALIQNGPLSADQEGYWAGIEELGYEYDLEKAKELMLEAGYTYNNEDMLEKDGETLVIPLIVLNGFDVITKTGEILKEQWAELGVDVELQVREVGVAYAALVAGDYQAAVFGLGWSNSELLSLMFHSFSIGGLNFSQLNNADLDVLLDTMKNTVDYDTHMKASKDAQIMILDQAYILPIFTQVNNAVISKRIQGFTEEDLQKYDLFPLVWTAYIVD